MNLFQLFNIAACAFLMGFTIAIIILDNKKHDFEEEYGDMCTQNKHLFPSLFNKTQVACFCEKLVLLVSDKGFLIVTL